MRRSDEEALERRLKVLGNVVVARDIDVVDGAVVAGELRGSGSEGSSTPPEGPAYGTARMVLPHPSQEGE